MRNTKTHNQTLMSGAGISDNVFIMGNNIKVSAVRETSGSNTYRAMTWTFSDYDLNNASGQKINTCFWRVNVKSMNMRIDGNDKMSHHRINKRHKCDNLSYIIENGFNAVNQVCELYSELMMRQNVA